MERDVFERLVAEEFPNAVPEQFRHLIQNVAFLIEDEPNENVRKEEQLTEHETLLGLYHGVPATARGDLYGVGAVLPDSITLYQLPIEMEAEFLCSGNQSKFEEMTRKVIRETIWHEVAHHFGYDEHQVRKKEGDRDAMLE